MFKKISFLMASLLTLSSCITMNGGKMGRSGNQKKKPEQSNPGESGGRGADAKLETLSNLPKLADKTKKENMAVLNEILKSLNKGENNNNKGKKPGKGQKGRQNRKGRPDKNGKPNPNGKPGKGSNNNNQENIDFALQALKGGISNLETLKNNVDNFINEYDNMDGYFLDPSYRIVNTRKSFGLAKTNLNIIKNYYLDKTQSDLGSKEKYIEYLKNKISKTDMSRKSFPDPKTKPDDYIREVEKAYKEKYKQFGLAGDDLNTLRGDLQNKITQAEAKINDAKQKILEEYKKIDPSYTANELPLAIDELIEKYKGNRRKILELLIQNKEKLKNLKSLADITNPNYNITTYAPGLTIATSGEDYVIRMGGREFAARDFSLETGRNNQQNGKDKDRKGKGKKPENNRASFYKAERQISSETRTFGTFMPGIKTELNKYGNDETEQKLRKLALLKLLSEFEAGGGDKNKVKNLLSAAGNDIGIKNWNDNYSLWNEEDKKKLKLLKDMLKQQTKPDFDIKVTENKKDIVRLGGKLAGLTFSDFGMWEVQTLSNYSGDKSLMKGLCKGDNKNKNCKFLLPLSEQQSEFNAFATGADKFKRRFKAGGEGTTKFTGKTIAGVSLFGDNGLKKSKTFDGTATLDITNNTGKGDFSFDYNNWYNFKFKNIDLTDPNGYEVNNHDVEVGGKGEKDFHFNLGANEKLTGKLKGALYGAEADKPTEGSGVFNIDVPNGKVLSDIYKTMKIDGAFGMTIPGAKTDRPEKGKGKGRKK